MLKLLFHSFQFIDTPYISGSLLPAATAPAFCNGPMDKRETASFCIGIIPLASAGANHSQALEHIFSHGQISKLTFWKHELCTKWEITTWEILKLYHGFPHFGIGKLRGK